MMVTSSKLHEKALKYAHLPFATMHLWETKLSLYTSTIRDYLNSLNSESDEIYLPSVKPDLRVFTIAKQCHSSHVFWGGNVIFHLKIYYYVNK